ncbi:tripartite tricarboxylate transporter substrate-binding protein [Variovorax sp. J22R24]|uniref:Bug family tripartite tricarboxylate transporter substrate binding protein n=1 Tax=Variovorax gracilis TaxID=3053502 RepID=UPI002574A831|nr:tripartite tricarboxylate transporter substrate-binding protein [Variovorax sp. J22R24]MDM0104061.1 tripartite tricarboxylate transporter substrate-binding protein [Variovorax sp. J22R24]
MLNNAGYLFERLLDKDPAIACNPPPHEHVAPQRRLLLRAALASTIPGAWLPAALAQPGERFPSRPIKLIVAFAPGTGSDALARIVATAMAPLLGQPLIVDNRAGAGGATGTEQGARAPADGYTLTLATTSTLLTHPALNPKARYRAERDFVPVAGLSRTAFVLVVADTPEAPRSLAELNERLARMGGSFGSPGVGTIGHLAAEYFLSRSGRRAVHVPYRGSGAALTDVAGGQLLFGCDTVVAALPLIRAARLRALFVTAQERLDTLSSVPTAAEAGMPQLALSAWWGLAAPAATSPAIVALLSDAVMKALASPEVRSQLASQQLEPMPLPSDAFGALIHSELPFWTEFVRQSGIRLEF